MNKRNMVIGFTLLALSATALVAQGTPPTPAQMVTRQVAHLTTLLTLTTAQQAQATTIFTNSQTTLTGLRTSFQTAQTALKTAVQANNVAGITTEANQLGSLTTQEVIAQSTANAAFYTILTPAQQTIYNEAGPGGGGGGGGFGGPGGRGPGGPPR